MDGINQQLLWTYIMHKAQLRVVHDVNQVQPVLPQL
jgi:hypothetical protein